jgi:YidC/Oxa1 family membrane protein insertase
LSDSEIVFEARQPHRRITKKFSLPKESNEAPYCFLLEMKIEGDTRGLWLTSGVPEVEWMSGGSEPVVKYRASKGNSYEVQKVDLPSQTFTLTSASPDWVCNSNGFFGLILDPTKGSEAGFKIERIDGEKDPSRLTLIDQNYDRFSAKDLPGFEVLLPVKPVSGHMEVRVFAGPFAESVLKTVDAHFLAEGGKISDYLSCQTFHGWFAFISEPFAKFLFFIMKLCFSVTHSWVFSIVFVTFVLRLILYPLNTWSLRSMKSMQEVAPQVKAIQERYKKEPQKAQMEIMALYREKGVNPLSGCLPLLLQLPFLIGMFDLLKSTFELRGASFIPGWIDNLTSPDVLFSWSTPLPLIGNQFHLLPILLGAIMYVQQNVMSSLPKDPSTWTDQQRQQRMMGNIMTVVMTFLFYNFPSGLNIYWISSMLLGIGQQWWVNRGSNKAKENPIVEVVAAPVHKHKKHKFNH